MNPAKFVQKVLSDALEVAVFGSVPVKAPSEFVFHTVVSNRPVSNGPVTASMDTTIAVSVVAESDSRAFELAHKVTEAFSDIYEQGISVAGTALAFFDAEMLPIRQSTVNVVTEKLSYQYNAQYQMLFA